MDFPLLVRLDSSNFDFSRAQGNGADIRFSKSDGNHLPYEIERWDPSAEIWVLMDTVRGDDSTQYIKMHWGNAGAADCSDGASVFKTTEGFAAVWHMNESSGNVNDATLNDNTGTNNGTTSAMGVIGNSREFDGSSQYIDAGSPVSLDDLSQFTISVWVYPHSTGSDGLGRIYSKNAMAFIISDGGDGDLAMYKGAATTQLKVKASANSWAINAWQHVAVTWNGGATAVTDAGLYVNGQEVNYELQQDAVDNWVSDSNFSALIGRDEAYDIWYFDGLMDEFKVSSSVRSAAWIKLCYENQRPDQVWCRLEIPWPWRIRLSLRPMPWR
jgi:hypothetical protein